MICKLAGLFVNILTTNDKYSLLNRDDLTQPIQAQISKKQKIYAQCFSAFLKSR